MPEAWAAPNSTRAALEAAPEGSIIVASALGASDAGIFGDILCARMVKRGLAGRDGRRGARSRRRARDGIAGMGARRGRPALPSEPHLRRLGATDRLRRRRDLSRRRHCRRQRRRGGYPRYSGRRDRNSRHRAGAAGGMDNRAKWPRASPCPAPTPPNAEIRRAQGTSGIRGNCKGGNVRRLGRVRRHPVATLPPSSDRAPGRRGGRARADWCRRAARPGRSTR